MTAPYSNVNIKNEDEEKEIILQETLLENSFTDVSKSERNIVKENLSLNNSADVSENTITEVKDKEHK